MNVTKAMQIIKDGLISDSDILEKINDLFEEVSNSAYTAGLLDNESQEHQFTAYGKAQDW